MVLSDKSCRWILISAIALLPVLVALSLRMETNTNDMLNWIPEDTAQSRVYQKYTKLFGEDDELIVSWEDCAVDDPRLAKFESRLVERNLGHGLFESINSGKSILDQLSDKKFSFPRKKLMQRLRKIVFDDEDNTAVLIQLSEYGKRDGNLCLNEILDNANNVDGLDSSQLKIAGNTFTNSQIEKSTQKTMLLSFPAILMAVCFTYFCQRSFRLTVASLLSAGFAALLCLGFISIVGAKFNSLLVMMPVLIIVLTFSATIHLCSYYKNCIRSSHPNPVNGMLEIGCRPCLLAVLTTAVGIAMLYVSHVQAIRSFGMFTAIGLVLSLTCILWLFPAILRVWKPSESELKRINESSWQSYLNFRIPSNSAISFSNVTVLFCLLLIPVFAYGLTKIESRLLVERMFSRKSAVNQNTKWMADRFSSVHSVEVVAEFPDNVDESDLLDEIRQLRKIQTGLARLNSVKSTMSMVNFCKIPSAKQSAKSFIESEIINESLKSEIQKLKARRLIAENDDHTFWRIRLGVDADFASEVESVLEEIEARFDEVSIQLESSPQGFVTGTWPMYTSGRNHMFSDLANSFVLAFLIITPIIMFLMRGIITGLVAMIPNVFPALAFFGSLGLLGIEIDTGTILTACVGLGIAIDDSLHYLHEYIRIRKTENVNRTLGAVSAVSSCIRPMTFTTLVCTIGLSVFVFSEFLPAQNFAIAICFLLGLALLCDVLFLPALIIGPLGRFFECEKLFAKTETNEIEPSSLAQAVRD